MNTTLKLLALVVALSVSGPTIADGVDEQIRNQGRAAIASLGAEIDQVLKAPNAPDADARYPVGEAIELQGRQAVRSIGLEMALTRYQRLAPSVVTTD